ncbi:hypothetical protein [Bacillus pseudomycoides]|uniref:hypothetical protein n=1 Tax=Bacillus pseudomycoides TaxID=64104 RepID=UPI000BECCF11|nr:hypothetical protein [Bacillus pseudomycoides]PDY44522.1 hypothetical protein CON79_25150 [Bacillus pseudomycoides]PHB52684.1 hypothetical protein COE83_01400 [Bacillus pseudomycoides]
MQINLVSYQVLLPRKFWEQANNEEELSQIIEKYFSVGYPHYEIQEVIESGQAHLAICIRR